MLHTGMLNRLEYVASVISDIITSFAVLEGLSEVKIMVHLNLKLD